MLCPVLPLTLIPTLAHVIIPGALVRLAKLIGLAEESEAWMGGRRYQKHVFGTDKVRTVSTFSEAAPPDCALPPIISF